MKKIVSQDRIVNFVDLTVAQLAKLPGKITRLHEKWRLGIPVPFRGFVIFPAVVNDIVRSKCDISQLPAYLIDELLSAYRQSNFERDEIRAAVRGALSVEDQSKASWAGGSESPTNILGEQEFLNAVDTCINETFSNRMDGYRDRMGIVGELKLSILVHQMAICNRFAVVFTRNPMNGSSDEIVIQSTFGGGQLLTAGRETGDIFILDRAGNVLSETVTVKELMVADEGVIPMPSQLKDKRSLEPNQLRDLVEFVLGVELIENDEPQDCEIALAVDGNGGIIKSLVQNRPITALDDSPGLVRYEAIKSAKVVAEAERLRLGNLGITVPLDVFSDQNIAELLTQHPTPFSFGLFTYIFAHDDGAIRTGRNMMGYSIGEELDAGFFELIGSQPRCSILHDALTYRISGVPLDDYIQGLVCSYLDQIRTDERLANYPEVVLYDQNPSLERLTKLYGPEKAKIYRQYYDRFFTGIRQWEQTFADDYLNVHEPLVTEFVNRQRQFPLSMSPKLIESLQTKLDFLRTKICIWFVIVARLGFFAYARLRKTLESNFNGEEAKQLLDHLTGSLQDDPAIRFNLRLAQLNDGLINRNLVLAEFGHLGFNELEISGPRYHEQPEMMDQLAARIKGDPQTELQRRIQESQIAKKRVSANLTEDRSREFEQDVVSTLTYLALRERVKFNFLKVYDLIRNQLLFIEAQLGWPQDHIFFLDPREIRMLIEAPAEALKIATHRRERYEREFKMEVPQVMFVDQLSKIGLVDMPDGASELYGIGVTSFVIEGPAVIVRDPSDREALEWMTDGCVLVVHTTDPTWAPIIGAVGNGGLVTEVGGPLAHGAIISRELGIAAVLNVKHATKIIKTGQRIRVDGPAGKVYILN
ncbi:MAG: PEP/pyruvate-binding domain-containing protein [Patescibacteria group bacterium]|nr:PEP/pyruvate-binding domain-containing protein [Patescibacteria group bacterium]